MSPKKRLERHDPDDLEAISRKIRAVALGIDGTATERALIQIAEQLEQVIGIKSPVPLKTKQRLYRFSVNRMAFATVKVYATDMDDAREKVEVQARMVSASGWSFDNEIEIDWLNSDGVAIDPDLIDPNEKRVLDKDSNLLPGRYDTKWPRGVGP